MNLNKNNFSVLVISNDDPFQLYGYKNNKTPVRREIHNVAYNLISFKKDKRVRTKIKDYLSHDSVPNTFDYNWNASVINRAINNIKIKNKSKNLSYSIKK